MNNAATGVTVPLSTFGGLSTELSPTDLPEGGCPDNSDCAFMPGTVMTRPALSRVYANPPTTAKIVYNDTFTGKDGSQYNVLMDSTGQIFVENFTSSPNSFTNVGEVAAGSKCKSSSAFGRLFMAFNDGLRGTDIPRSLQPQADGAFKWNRVSQGGPAGNPTFAETIGASVSIAAIAGGGAGQSIAALNTSSPYTVTRRVWVGDGWDTVTTTYYRYIDITVGNASGFSVGQIVTVSGCSQGNGQYAISSISGNDILVGYYEQAVVSGTGGTVSAGSASITMSRASDVVTAGTASAHGLQPGDMFTVSGVADTVLGGTISAASRISNVATITTTSANGIRVGSVVIIAGATDTTFNGTWTVTAVLSATQFQVTSSNLADATSSSGTVSGQWNNTQRFVVSIPTATSLTYLDPGPDTTTTGTGTIAPVGQVAAGQRNAVCMFQTDYGFITSPSFPIQVTSSGGKKLVLNNIPIGPSNVIARIIAFTGVDGSRYSYIPVPARSNGNVISTSTVLSDNTSTSAIFDFSDATLLSASGIDIAGNNLFDLKILGNCSGVLYYADRMLYWGDENVATNFLNMGFEGGADASGNPLGWTVVGSGLAVVGTGDFGGAIQFAAGSTGLIYQSAYLDYYGDEIIQPNTQYTFKCWAKQSGSGAYVIAELYDTNSHSIVASASVAVPSAPGFVSARFSNVTPESITPTTVLRIRVINNTTSLVTVDELRVIYTTNPYNDTDFAVSYVLNPESVDAVTGIMGATADPTPIMDASRMRDNLYFVTQSTLQTTKDLASAEPSSWSIAELARQCGACSMFSMISGESWLGWASIDGYRLFDGSVPIKITQDFQSKWDAINPLALTSIWAVNDVQNRRMYWGVPLNSSTDTNSVYMLDYRYAETASAIEDRGAIRISAFSGKILVIELSRKFSPWTIAATVGGMIARASGILPSFSDANGRTYTLDPTKLHDDDYGTIPSYFVTSPFVSGELEQALQLGNNRHLYTFLSAFISGTGQITITPLADSLQNPWPSRGPYALSASPNRVMEIPLNVAASRCFFKFAATPVGPSLDAAFSLSRMAVTMQPHPFSPVWGMAGATSQA